MSGGVDSSVAAYLMKQAGYQCMGTTLKLHEEDEALSREGEVSPPQAALSRERTAGSGKTCCSLSDVEDARAVAAFLDIPYYVFNFTEYFEEAVIRRFVDTYIAGGTPNPCIDCNRYIKFEKLLNRMYELDYDYVVTGHYARISYDEGRGRYLLKKGIDENKDQSYVLYSLTQEQLSHTLFPLGEYRKTEIREIAEAQGFVNAHKSDSQDICFVPDGDYAGFIERYTGRAFPKGNFVLADGTVIGGHRGMIRYTIGQRKGLGLSLPAPLYVCGKDMEKNEVLLGTNEMLFTTAFTAADMNWIAIPELTEPLRCKAKIRYKQKEAEAVVSPLPDGQVQVVFDESQRGITNGQAVVLYDGDVVIGGGTIVGGGNCTTD